MLAEFILEKAMKIVQAWSDDCSKIVREMIFKENEFINHRLGWLVTLQGLLFTALGFAWKNAQELICLLVVMGIIVPFTSFCSLSYAQQAIIKQKSDWEENRSCFYVGPDVIGYFNNKWYAQYFLPWVVLPILFIIIWLGVLGIHLRRDGLQTDHRDVFLGAPASCRLLLTAPMDFSW